MTDATQPDLFSPKPPMDADRDVAWLEKFLLGGQIWFTASDILLAVQRPANDAGKRWLRNLASNSGYVVAGQKGYRHLQHASAEEIHHACAWMESQAKLMGERAGRLRGNAYKLFGDRKII